MLGREPTWFDQLIDARLCACDEPENTRAPAGGRPPVSLPWSESSFSARGSGASYSGASHGNARGLSCNVYSGVAERRFSGQSGSAHRS